MEDKPETAYFIDRTNRFTVEARLNGRTVKAYLPNPGRLWELLFPGAPIYLVKNGEEGLLPYTMMAVLKEGTPILLHTHMTNLVVEKLLKARLIPGLEEMEIERREATFGHSRYDFLLSSNGEAMILEVKNCTLFGKALAMFPDAVTARGSRHLEGLLEIARKGTRTGVLFVVQWPMTRYFMPEYHTDPYFSKTLLSVRERIMVKAIALRWHEDLSLDEEVRELEIPWQYIESHGKDRGSYIIILHVPGEMRISVGGLGPTFFRPGYYIYVGSALRGLTQRMARHERKRKNLFWHIDYLREQAAFHKGLAIRTPLDLECQIASRVREISEWLVPGFGSSDCGCATHLYAMETDPVKHRPFVEMLNQFRIGMIEEELERETVLH